MDSDGTILFYTRDHLGSVRELTDSTQAVRARYDYDPYGRVTKVAGDRDSAFTYTGHFWHASSQLNLALFRAYDPSIGRWISLDPLKDREIGGTFIEVAEGPNLYTYCLNKPIAYDDKLGLACRLVGNTVERTDRLKDFRDLSTWQQYLVGGTQWLLGVRIGGMRGNIAGICNFKVKQLWEKYKRHITQTFECDSPCGGTYTKRESRTEDSGWHVTETHLEVSCWNGPPLTTFNIGGSSPPNVSGFGSW